MSLILINGISTSGKSTIARELTLRNYEVYDTELDIRISVRQSRQFDENAAEFSHSITHDHRGRIQLEKPGSKEWLNRVVKRSNDNMIILCGNGKKDEKIYPLCDKVIWLHVDEHTIRNRLSLSSKYNHRISQHELENILEQNRQEEKVHQQYGAKIVNATKLVPYVVNDILKCL